MKRLSRVPLKTHWKILLVGARGAGMFNHSDSLQTSSWHLTVSGRKWWYVCGTLSNETSSKCLEGVVAPGEVSTMAEAGRTRRRDGRCSHHHLDGYTRSFSPCTRWPINCTGSVRGPRL